VVGSLTWSLVSMGDENSRERDRESRNNDDGRDAVGFEFGPSRKLDLDRVNNVVEVVGTDWNPIEGVENADSAVKNSSGA